VPVTVFLINGAQLDAALASFRARDEKLQLFATRSPGDQRFRVMNSENIAAIGFREPSYEKPGVETEHYKVRVSGDHSFRVEAERKRALGSRRGFLGWVSDRDSDIRSVFFYRHGILVCEEDRPIGSMLVDQGAIGAQELQRGVRAQEEGRRLSLDRILLEQGRFSERSLAQAMEREPREKGAMDTVVSLPEPGRPSLPPLGELLIEEGLVTQSDIERALILQQRLEGRRLGEVLLEMGLVGEQALTTVLARKFQLPFVDLGEFPPTQEALQLVAPVTMRELGFLPLQLGRSAVTVAITDPMDSEMLERLRFLMHTEIREVLVVPSQLQRFLDDLETPGPAELEVTTSVRDMARLATEALEACSDGSDGKEALWEQAWAPEVGKLVSQLFREALDDGATDIHLSPREEGLAVSMRVDGFLEERQVLDQGICASVLARIKLVAGVDMRERRAAQEGRILLRQGRDKVEVRVSSLRVIQGESVVLHLGTRARDVDLRQLGFQEEHARTLARLCQRPFGMVLVTGPSGSGCTTTLRGLLGNLVGQGQHVISVEDPVETEIPGVTQIEVDEAAGLGCRKALRQALRHDPDVLLVGGLRDGATAMMAVEAALNGHLVLSSLNTSSTTATVGRLLDMGIPSYLLAPALLAVLSQRLVRRLCPSCRKSAPLERAIERRLEAARLRVRGPFFRAGACEKCKGRGYLGRALLYELLVLDSGVRAAIHEGAPQEVLVERALASGLVPRGQLAVGLAQRGLVGMEVLLHELS